MKNINPVTIERNLQRRYNNLKNNLIPYQIPNYSGVNNHKDVKFNFVPYSNPIKDVNLGRFNLSCNDINLSDDFEITTIATFQPYENWEGKTVSYGSGSVDTTNYLMGTQAYKLTTNSDSTAWVGNTICLNDINGDGVDFGGIGVFAYINNFDDTKYIYVGISESENFDTSNYHYNNGTCNTTVLTRHRVRGSGWVLLVFSKRGWQTVGSPTALDDTTNFKIKSLRLGVRRMSGGPNASVTFGKVVTFKPKKAGIIINFDDAKKSAYTNAFPDLIKRNYRAVLPVITKNVCMDWKSGVSYSDGDRVNYGGKVWESEIDNNTDEPGTSSNWTEKDYMTHEEVTEMYNLNWDVVAHTHTHPTAGTYTDVELNKEFVLCKKTMEFRGWYRGSDILVFPGNRGETSSGAYAMDVANGFFKIIRGTSKASDQLEHTLMDQLPSCWVPEFWNTLPYFAMYSQTGNFNYYKEDLDNMVSRKEVILLYLHGVTDNYGSVDISLSDWKSLVEWIDENVKNEKLKVMTFTEWFNSVRRALMRELEGTPIYFYSGIEHI